MVVMGWKANSWQHTHMKICSILRRKFFRGNVKGMKVGSTEGTNKNT